MNFLASTNVATKQANALVAYFTKTNWGKLSDTLISHVLQLALISIVFIVILRLGRGVIKRSFGHYNNLQSADSTSGRSATIASLTQNTFSYVVYFFYAYSFLSIIGIPVGTLFAGAGIVGLAVGFGAQGFVSDIVNGFFIILEGQLDVGDSVQIAEIIGTVKVVGLRTTQVVSPDGTLNFIPNRSIGVVRNSSRNDMKAIVNIPLADGSQTPLLEQVIRTVNAKMTKETAGLIAAPQLLGLTQTAWGGFAYSVQLTVQPGTQLSMQRLFLTAYVDAAAQAGVKLRDAVPPQIHPDSQ